MNTRIKGKLFSMFPWVAFWRLHTAPLLIDVAHDQRRVRSRCAGLHVLFDTLAAEGHPGNLTTRSKFMAFVHWVLAGLGVAAARNGRAEHWTGSCPR